MARRNFNQIGRWKTTSAGANSLNVSNESLLNAMVLMKANSRRISYHRLGVRDGKNRSYQILSLVFFWVPQFVKYDRGDERHRGSPRDSETADLPALLHISGNPQLMDVAYHHKTVRLELLGLTSQPALGRDHSTILVGAEPYFTAISKYLKRLGANALHKQNRDLDRRGKGFSSTRARLRVKW